MDTETRPDASSPWSWLSRPGIERPPERRCTWIVGPPGSGKSHALRRLAAGAGAGRRRGPATVILDDLDTVPPAEVLAALTTPGAMVLASSSPHDELAPEVLRALRAAGTDRRVLAPLTEADVAWMLEARWPVIAEEHTVARLHSLSGGAVGVLRAVVDDALDASLFAIRHGVLRLRGEIPLSRADLYLDAVGRETAAVARILDGAALADGLPYAVLVELGGEEAVEDLIAEGELLPDDDGSVLHHVPELARHRRVTEMDPGLRRHRLGQVDAAAARIGADDTVPRRPPADLPADALLFDGPWEPGSTPGVVALEVLARSGMCLPHPDDAGAAHPAEADPARDLHDLAVAALSGHHEDVRAAAGALRTLEATDPRIAAAVALFETYGLLLGGRIEESAALADDLHRRYRLRPRLSAVAVGACAISDIAAGELERARRRFTSVVAEFADEPWTGWAVYALCGLAIVSDFLGDAAGRALAGAEVERIPAEWGLFAASAAATRAWATDRGEEAVGHLAEACRAAAERGQSGLAVSFAMELIRVGGEEAARAVDTASGPEFGLGELRRYREAVLSGDRGVQRRLAEDYRRRGIRVFAIALYVRLAQAYRAEGLTARSVEAAAIARELSAESGAPRVPSLQLLSGVADLTPREREAAQLVSRGMTNRRIAEELGLSVRTVEGHVMRACRRIGVETREDLAEALSTVLR